MTRELEVNDWVTKSSGDYRFQGRIVAKFHKFNEAWVPDGPVRYVVQDIRGLLMIMSESQLELGAGQ